MIIEEAKKKIGRLKMVFLDVFSINNKAQSLYKKLGFKEVGHFPKTILYRDKYINDIKIY